MHMCVHEYVTISVCVCVCDEPFQTYIILYLRNGTEIEDTLVLNVFHVCEYIRDMV